MLNLSERLPHFSRDINLFLIFNLLVYIGSGVFALIFNLYLVALGLREDFIGVFNAGHTLSIAAAGMTRGPVLRRVGTWNAVFFGASAFTVISLALAIAESQPVLLILAALYGIAVAYLSTTTMPFLIDWGSRTRRAEESAVTFSLISLAGTLGSLVGGFVPALIGQVVGEDGDNVVAYRWTIIIGTVLASTSLIPMLMMGEARRARPHEEVSHAERPEAVPDKQRTRSDMAVFVAVGGIMALGIGMVAPFYNVYLTTLGATASQVGFIFAAGGIAAAIIGLGAPALAARLGSLRAIFWVRISVVPAYLLLLLHPTLAVAVIAHLVRMVSVSMGWPLDSTFIAELLPPGARSSVFGLRSASWNMLWSVASLIGGWVIVGAGYSWTFASLVVFSAAAVLLFTLYYGRHPRVLAGEVPTALSPKQRARLVMSAPEVVAAEQLAEEISAEIEEQRDQDASEENVPPSLLIVADTPANDDDTAKTSRPEPDKAEPFSGS
jgi:MFS family permease